MLGSDQTWRRSFTTRSRTPLTAHSLQYSLIPKHHQTEPMGMPICQHVCLILRIWFDILQNNGMRPAARNDFPTMHPRGNLRTVTASKTKKWLCKRSDRQDMH